MEKSKNYRLKFVKYIKRDHVDYLIRLICLEDDKISVEFLERYSAFKDLHEVFKKEANSINFPKFPPKKIWWNTDEKFLNQRQTALEHYFNTILGSKEFYSLPSIKKWIETIITKYNRTASTATTVKSTEEKPTSQYVSRPNPVEANQQTSSLKHDIQKWKETVDKYSKIFIDLGNDNNPHYESEDCFLRERNYKNVLRTNNIFNNLNSKLFKIEAGNNSNFDFLGLEESKIVKYDTSMIGKLNQMYKIINSVIPDDYIVEELVTKIDINRK